MRIVPRDASAESGRAGRPVLLSEGTVRNPRAIVILLHGGREHSDELVSPRNLAVVRMRGFVPALRSLGGGVAITTMRYRSRGWNEPHAHPVEDVRWALSLLSERHPGVPVVLVGHSMGGRSALRAAGHPNVRGVVGLAPWLPPGEPIDQLAGRDVAIMHGDRDRTTRAVDSLAFVARARAVARSVAFEVVNGGGHAMVRHAGRWHERTATFVRIIVDGQPVNAPST
jgi:alpha-beta hydrolase superfamily lysophospholipase